MIQRISSLLAVLPIVSWVTPTTANWSDDGFSFAYDENDNLLSFPPLIDIEGTDYHKKVTISTETASEIALSSTGIGGTVGIGGIGGVENLPKTTRHLPQDLYTAVLQNTAIACVDVLLYNPAIEKYLVLRRDQHPIKNKLAYIGGRLHLGESFYDGARRKVLEEIFGGDEGKLAAEGLNKRRAEKGEVLEQVKPILMLHDVISVYNTMFENSAASQDIPTQTVNTLVFGEIWGAEMVGYDGDLVIHTDSLHSGHLWLTAQELLQHPDATLYVKKGLFDYLDQLERSTGVLGYLPTGFENLKQFAVKSGLEHEKCLAWKSANHFGPCLTFDPLSVGRIPDMSNPPKKRPLGTPHEKNSTKDLLDIHSFYHDKKGDKIFGKERFRARIGMGIGGEEGEGGGGLELELEEAGRGGGSLMENDGLGLADGEIANSANSKPGIDVGNGKVKMIPTHIPPEIFTEIAQNTVLVTVDTLFRCPQIENLPPTARQYLFLKRDHAPMKNKLRFLGGRLRVFETFFDVAKRQFKEVLKIAHHNAEHPHHPYIAENKETEHITSIEDSKDLFEKHPLKFSGIVGSYTTHFEKSNPAVGGGAIQTINVVILVDISWELLAGAGIHHSDSYYVDGEYVDGLEESREDYIKNNKPTLHNEQRVEEGAYGLLTAGEFLKSRERAKGYFGAVMRRHLEQEGMEVPVVEGIGREDRTTQITEGGETSGVAEVKVKVGEGHDEMKWNVGPDGEVELGDQINM